MASEDSDQLLPGLSPVHRLRDLCDLDEPLGTQMTIALDDVEARDELLEVRLLRGVKRIPAKERHDHLAEIDPSPDDEAEQVLVVVVVATIRYDLAHPEELTQLVERVDAGCALRNRELVSHLVAGLVAGSTSAALLADEADREASFSVYKTDDPAKPNQPFLLVFRTIQIVTAHESTLERVPDGYTGFSSI
jgi:hypothetical protein